MRKFEKLIFDLKNGIKRKISSRRLKIQVTVEEFHLLSKKYFLELKKGAEKGARIISGMDMLIAQAIFSINIWFGIDAFKKIDIIELKKELSIYYAS